MHNGEQQRSVSEAGVRLSLLLLVGATKALAILTVKTNEMQCAERIGFTRERV